MPTDLKVFSLILVVLTAGYVLGGVLLGLHWRAIPATNINGLLLGLGLPFFLAMLVVGWAIFIDSYREEKRIRKIRETPGDPLWFLRGP